MPQSKLIHHVHVIADFIILILMMLQLDPLHLVMLAIHLVKLAQAETVAHVKNKFYSK